MKTTYNYRIEVNDGITTKVEKGSMLSYCSGTTSECSEGTICVDCNGTGKCSGTIKEVVASGSGIGSYYLECKYHIKCQWISGANSQMVYNSASVSCKCGYVLWTSWYHSCKDCAKAQAVWQEHNCTTCGGIGGSKCEHEQLVTHYVCAHSKTGNKHL